MIRRPPSVIPVRHSDVQELEAFLAAKRAGVTATSSSTQATRNINTDAQQRMETDTQADGNTADKSTKTSKGKGRAVSPEASEAETANSAPGGSGQDRARREQRIGL